MQLAYTANIVQNSTPLETAEASIKADAHLLRILSSGLYSNKIRTVLREIGCNAADAHIELGIGHEPIEVHLPSKANPHFWIKDKGPGMPHDFVMQNYQRYGHSEKRASDTQTGAFGFGSKSPYAYTDQFTVESAHGGVLNRYQCYIKQNGMFATNHIESRPADPDWPTGVRVMVPVREIDIAEFHNEATIVFRWFRVRPTILNGKIEVPKISLQTDHVTLFDSTPSHEHNYLYVYCGNVAYPVDAYALNKTEIGGTLNDFERSFINMSAAMDVPLGSFDIAVSRESPEYTNRTIINLKKAIRSSSAELAQHIAQHYTPKTLRWEDLPDLRTKAQINDDWAEYIIPALKKAGYTDHTPNLIRDVLHRSLIDTTKGVLTDINSTVWWYRLVSDFRGKTSWRKSQIDGRGKIGSSFVLLDKPKCALVVADKPNADARIRTALSEGLYDQAILVSPKYVTDDTMSKEERREARKEAKDKALDDVALLSERLLHMPRVPVDTLPKITTSQAARRKFGIAIPRVSAVMTSISKDSYNTTIDNLQEKFQDSMNELAEERENEGEDLPTLDEVLNVNYRIYLDARYGTRIGRGHHIQLSPRHTGVPMWGWESIVRAIHTRLKTTDSDLAIHAVGICDTHWEKHKFDKRMTLREDLADVLLDWFKPIAEQYKDLVIHDHSIAGFMNSVLTDAANTPTTMHEFLAHALQNTPFWQTLVDLAPKTRFVAPIVKHLHVLEDAIGKNTASETTDIPEDLDALQSLAAMLTPIGLPPAYKFVPTKESNALAALDAKIHKDGFPATYWDGLDKLSSLKQWGLFSINKPEFAAAILNNWK